LGASVGKCRESQGASGHCGVEGPGKPFPA
jgi:hypothetical protein